MMYKVKDRQTIFDIAIEACGTWMAAFDIAELNNRSITDELTSGEELAMPSVQNTHIADHYERERLSPATDISEREINTLLYGGEGIGYWRVEKNFVVQ